jgi:hypothetical protein
VNGEKGAIGTVYVSNTLHNNAGTIYYRLLDGWDSLHP